MFKLKDAKEIQIPTDNCAKLVSNSKIEIVVALFWFEILLFMTCEITGRFMEKKKPANANIKIDKNPEVVAAKAILVMKPDKPNRKVL